MNKVQWKPLVIGLVASILVALILALTLVKGAISAATSDLSLITQAENMLLLTMFVGGFAGALIMSIGYKARFHFLVVLVGGILAMALSGMTTRLAIGLEIGSQQITAFIVFGILIGIVSWLIGFLVHKFSKKTN